MTEYEYKINVLFEQLVPPVGKADTVAGEIIRAVSRIGYRNYNDGDHIGVGYGKETCNPAARFLIQTCGGDVGRAVLDAWGLEDDGLYDKAVEDIERAVLEYLERRPDLKHTINHIDMWDCRDEYEDVDYYEEEDE